jgi:hypothetical protein
VTFVGSPFPSSDHKRVEPVLPPLNPLRIAALRGLDDRAARSGVILFRSNEKAMWSVDEPPYTLGEAARLLGVSRATVGRLFDGEEGVLILSATGARRKMRRIPRPVFNRVLNRLSQPKTESPYYPFKFRQPIVSFREYPQKARKYTEADRRKMSEVMRRVWAAKKARQAIR